MTIIADATALILLAKITLLETFIDRNKVIIPETVLKEVLKGKEKNRIDSMLLEKLSNERKLNIQTPSEQTKINIKKLINLKKGELDVISLAYKTNNIILSDDKKCINAAKVFGISFITTPDVVIIMYNKKVITKNKAILSIDKLEEYGWYSKDIIKNHRRKIK